MKGRIPFPDKMTDIGQRPAGEPPAAPAFLSDEAQVEWNRVVPDLHRRGIMTTADTDAVAAYCETYSQYLRMVDVLQKEPMILPDRFGTPKPHAAVGIINNLLKHIRGFCKDFGFTPSSRGKMNIKGTPTKDDDDFNEFMNGRTG